MLRRCLPHVKNLPDDRSIMAQAIAWSSRVTTISLEMVIPGMIGCWIDRKLGTVMLFLVVGMVFGVTSGMIHLIRWTAQPGAGPSSDRKRPGASPDDDNRHD